MHLFKKIERVDLMAEEGKTASLLGELVSMQSSKVWRVWQEKAGKAPESVTAY